MDFDVLNKAKRINQAYENSYGPEVKLNGPIMRDMAADKVIERRSWFPAISTADWFASPTYMTRHDNMEKTRGIDLKNRETFRARARPGEIAYQSSFGPVPTVTLGVVGGDDGGSSNTWIYVIGILLVIIVLVTLF